MGQADGVPVAAPRGACQPLSAAGAAALDCDANGCAARDDIGLLDGDPHPVDAGIVDVKSDEITQDPLGCVRRIYDHFDLELSPEAQKRMRAFVDDNPREKHGVHRYGLDEFGLDQDSVDAAFEEYRERFHVKREPYT